MIFFIVCRWIEVWQRKHRQYQEDRCTSYNEFTNFEREEDEFNCWDNGWDDDLRETFCQNKNNMSLSNVLKMELECGWDAASHIIVPNTFALLLFPIVLVIIY